MTCPLPETTVTFAAVWANAAVAPNTPIAKAANTVCLSLFKITSSFVYEHGLDSADAGENCNLSRCAAISKKKGGAEAPP